jgi:hypothetical protein
MPKGEPAAANRHPYKHKQTDPFMYIILMGYVQDQAVSVSDQAMWDLWWSK